ncbi:MAG: inositol monophosphatase [bacterium]
MNNFDKELETAVNIAKEAGTIMLKYFDDDQHVEIKADNSPVTIADKLINSLVIEKLAQTFSDDGVVGEEESTSGYGMGRKWICDPIDGTAGYTWSTPTAMFSLALVVDGKPVLGVAYDPFLNKMYIGRKGLPSECNNLPISVSKESIQEGVVGVTGSIRNLMKFSHTEKLIEDKIKLACFSGAVYKAVLVAKGKFVGFIELGANAHDVAAVHIIVEGAGGKITSPDGKELDYSKPFKGCVISNGLVHDKLLEYCV